MLSKRLLRLALVSIAGLHGIHSASAQLDYLEGLYGWYEAGAVLVQDATLRDFPDEITDGNRVKFDTGFHFGIGIGRELTPYVSLEAESGFNYNALRSIGGATISDGNFYRVPIMGNVVFKYPNRSRFLPVIGGGAGAQWTIFDAQNVEFGATTLDDDEDTWCFAYQGFAGVYYRFRDNMSAGLFYRYNVADGPSWNFESFGGRFKLNAMRTHSLALTLGWYF